MNILVTGGAGFIGKYLVKELVKRDHNVVAFDLEYGDDIQDSMSGTYDAIFHFAVLPRPQAQQEPQKAVDVNVKGTVNVLELARRCGAKVIFSSASSVYGIPMHSPVGENNPINPVSVYGATKRAAELFIQTYYKLYSSINYLIFRFTNVYGPNQKGTREVIPAFLNSIRNEDSITIYGSGKQVRDFVYIDDVVHFLIRALEPDKKNMILNLGSSKETSIIELVKIIENVTEKKAEIISRPVELEERFGFTADITRMENVFGEVPKVSLEDGLRKMWEEMKE